MLAPEERHRVERARRCPSMLRAAAWPWRSATTQCSTRMRSPVCGSGQRAMSPAAKMPGRAGLQVARPRRRRDRAPARPSRPAPGSAARRCRRPRRSAGKRVAVVERDAPSADRLRRPARGGRRRRAPRAARGSKSPSSGPSTRSSGRSSGATTCTSSLRARSEAATSSPMKLAPITTARRASARRRDDARGCRPACAGSARAAGLERLVEPDGLGAGGEQQRAVRQARCRRRGARACAVASMRATRGAETQLDVRAPVELRRTQRNPVLGRAAGEVVLRKVRPVDGASLGARSW